MIIPWEEAVASAAELYGQRQRKGRKSAVYGKRTWKSEGSLINPEVTNICSKLYKLKGAYQFLYAFHLLNICSFYSDVSKSSLFWHWRVNLSIFKKVAQFNEWIWPLIAIVWLTIRRTVQGAYELVS